MVRSKSKQVKSMILDDVDMESAKEETRKNMKEIRKEIDEIDQSDDEEEEEFEFEGDNDAPKIKLLSFASLAAIVADYADGIFEKKDKSESKTEKVVKKPINADDDVRQTEDKTIFVKNLPFGVQSEDLKKALQTLFINATDEIRLLTKNNGTCRGKAFIEMKSVETAESAAKYGKWELMGRKLEVDLCGSKSKNSEKLSKLETATLSVKANTEFDIDDLADVFTEPCDIRIPNNGMNIAYVQFEDNETAKKYYDSKGLEINGENLILEFVPDRHTAPAAVEKDSGRAEDGSRVKGAKWANKKAVKRSSNEPEESENYTKSFKYGGRGGGTFQRGRGDSVGFRGRGRGDSGGFRGRGRGDSGGFRGRGRGDSGGFRGRGGRGDSRGRGGSRGGRGDSRGGSRGRGNFDKPRGAFKRD